MLTRYIRARGDGPVPTCLWLHSFHIAVPLPFLPGNPEATGLLICVLARAPHLLAIGEAGEGGNSQLTAEPQGLLEEQSPLHVWHLSSCRTPLKEQSSGKGLSLITLGQRRPAYLMSSTGKGPGWGFLSLSQGKQASKQQRQGPSFINRRALGPKDMR